MEECPSCKLLNCFYDKLKLTPEERRIVEKLRDNPQKAIEYLEKIRPKSQLKLAFRSCGKKI